MYEGLAVAVALTAACCWCQPAYSSFSTHRRAACASRVRRGSGDLGLSQRALASERHATWMVEMSLGRPKKTDNVP